MSAGLPLARTPIASNQSNRPKVGPAYQCQSFECQPICDVTGKVKFEISEGGGYSPTLKAKLHCTENFLTNIIPQSKFVQKFHFKDETCGRTNAIFHKPVVCSSLPFYT
jgi:hypothetical protein